MHGFLTLLSRPIPATLWRLRVCKLREIRNRVVFGKPFMEALVLHAPRDLRIEKHQAMRLMPGQVMVRIEVGGICDSDLSYYTRGGFGAATLAEPIILGHELAGIVEALGPAVLGLQIGDRVAINPSRPCGQCNMCRAGLPNHCRQMRFYGSIVHTRPTQGGFCRDLVCDATQCFPARFAGAAELALAEPFSVALHAAERAGSLRGKRVLVMGCGPVGALVVAAARLHGARDIVAADVVREKLGIVRGFGARTTFDLAEVPDGLAAWTDMIDVAFECSGMSDALQNAVRALRPRGTLVQVGIGQDLTLAQGSVVAKELTVLGSYRFHEEFGTAVSLIDSGRAALGSMITHSFPLDDATCAFEAALDRRRAVKVQLTF